MKVHTDSRSLSLPLSSLSESINAPVFFLFDIVISFKADKIIIMKQKSKIIISKELTTKIIVLSKAESCR